MGNLGSYQTMTTLAKKVGGPKYLGATVAIGGYLALRTVEWCGKKAFKRVKNNLKAKDKVNIGTCTVHTVGESNEGVQFEVGDQFRVLEIANDAVLIEKFKDTNNPYFVSADLLRSISDFEL